MSYTPTGTEVFQVLPIQSNGYPAAETVQVTTQQVANLAQTGGLSVTITTAKLTGGGTNGSMTFAGGILIAETAAT